MELKTTSANDVKMRIVPSGSRLYEFAIQAVMRDYADVADEMNAGYMELGSAVYDDEYYTYLGKLEKAFANRIKQVIREQGEAPRFGGAFPSKGGTMFKGRGKADFRARRELVGLTQGDIADALGVTQMSVYRWEREGFNDPPDEAWNLIEIHEAEQDRAVGEIVEAFPDNSTAAITIYRTQQEYDAVQALYGREDRGSFGAANASALEAARTLDALGVEVRFRYPDVE